MHVRSWMIAGYFLQVCRRILPFCRVDTSFMSPDTFCLSQDISFMLQNTLCTS